MSKIQPGNATEVTCDLSWRGGKFTISLLHRPCRTSSSFAARASICQFQRKGVAALSSINDRCKNPPKSLRNISAKMFGGEGAISLAIGGQFTLLHALIDGLEHFHVSSAEWILNWSCRRRPFFEFVQIV